MIIESQFTGSLTKDVIKVINLNDVKQKTCKYGRSSLIASVFLLFVRHSFLMNCNGDYGFQNAAVSFGNEEKTANIVYISKIQ